MSVAVTNEDTPDVAASGNTLWWRLIARKRELGLNTEEAGRLCGVSQATFNRWEHQKRTPEDDQLVAVAKFLGVRRADVVLWRSGEDRSDLVGDELADLRRRMAELAAELKLLRPGPTAVPPPPSS